MQCRLCSRRQRIREAAWLSTVFLRLRYCSCPLITILSLDLLFGTSSSFFFMIVMTISGASGLESCLTTEPTLTVCVPILLLAVADIGTWGGLKKVVAACKPPPGRRVPKSTNESEPRVRLLPLPSILHPRKCTSPQLRLKPHPCAPSQPSANLLPATSSITLCPRIDQQASHA